MESLPKRSNWWMPQEASVACSTAKALEWDEAFKNMNEPSGRAIAKVHDDAYVKI